MARIYSRGFEFNTNTAGVEWDGTGDTPSIQTATVRSGTYAGRIVTLTTGVARFWQLQQAAADANGPFWTRFYLLVHTSTTVNTTIFQYGNDAGTAQPMDIVLTTADKLQVTNNLGIQIGSDSAALSKDVWYRIEAKYDASGGANATIIEARIDGVNFVSQTNTLLATQVDNVAFGGNLKGESATTIDIFFDDIAINDSTGTGQTTYPGSEKLIRLAGNATGDVNSFATQTGGVAGAGNNFSRINEVTPDGATTFNGSSTLNEEDLVNCDNSGIGATDTVNVVEVHVNFRNSTADATGAFKLEIEKAPAGTVLQSAAIVPNSTTFRQNTKATLPRTPPLVTYLNPDGAAWTQATLDTMQIGYKLTTAPGTAGRRCDITSCVAIVGYTPAAATPAFISRLMMSGMGR